MSEALVGRLAVKSKTLKPGDGWAVEMQPDELLQIIALDGKQVSDFVAMVAQQPAEVLSTTITRSKNNSIMLQKGMTIYSNLRNAMFEVVEDTVGRHDMLFAACDPRRYADDYGLADHASCRSAFAAALEPHGLGFDAIPDPINVFMNVAILQRGELEIRESLAEAGDFILLRATQPVVAAMTACPQDQNDVNGGKPSDILVRLFR
ncbi:MAG: urea carboxylase-associated family protein [Thermomicrobiales bacterium]|nr:urea carboxylase-associated family protein [Thermomicrobiales bacterium]